LARRFFCIYGPPEADLALAGRTPRDGSVAVVSRTFESRFVDGSALGLTIDWRSQLLTVGVAADSRPYHPSDDADAFAASSPPDDERI
jgi:hypothetical protein